MAWVYGCMWVHVGACGCMDACVHRCMGGGGAAGEKRYGGRGSTCSGSSTLHECTWKWYCGALAGDLKLIIETGILDCVELWNDGDIQ
jgi:hypothetical protein